VFSGGSVDTSPTFVVTRGGAEGFIPGGEIKDIFTLSADQVGENGTLSGGEIPQFYQDSFEVSMNITPVIPAQERNSVNTYTVAIFSYWASVNEAGAVEIQTKTENMYAEVVNPTNGPVNRFATTSKIVRFAPPSNTPGGNYVLLGIRGEIRAPETPQGSTASYEFLVRFPNRDPNQENTTLITSIQGFYQGPITVTSSQLWSGVPTDATLLQKSGAVVRPSGSTQRDLIHESISSTMGSLGTSRILSGNEVAEWDAAVANPTSMASLMKSQPGSLSAGLRDIIATGEYKAAGFGDFLTWGQKLARSAAPVLSAINPVYGGIANMIGNAPPLSASGMYRAGGLRGRYNASGETVVLLKPRVGGFGKAEINLVSNMGDSQRTTLRGRYNASGQTVVLRKPRVGGFGKAEDNLTNAQNIGSPQELLNLRRLQMRGTKLSDIMPKLGKCHASGNEEDLEAYLEDNSRLQFAAPDRILPNTSFAEYKEETPEEGGTWVDEYDDDEDEDAYQAEQRQGRRDIRLLNERSFLTQPTQAPSEQAFKDAMEMASAGFAVHPYMVGLGPFVSGNARAIASNMGDPKRTTYLSSQTFPVVSVDGVALVSLVLSPTAMDTPADMPGFAELLLAANQDSERLTPEQLSMFRYYPAEYIMMSRTHKGRLTELLDSPDATGYNRYIADFGAYRLYVDRALSPPTKNEVVSVFQDFVHLMPKRTDRIRDVFVTMDAYDNVLTEHDIDGPSLQLALIGAMAGGPTGLILTGAVGPDGKVKAIANVKDKTQSFEAREDPKAPLRPMIVIPLDNAKEYEPEFAAALRNNYIYMDYEGMMKLRVICIDNIKDLFWVLQGPVYKAYMDDVDPDKELLKTATRWREAFNAATVVYAMQAQLQSMQESIESGVSPRGTPLSEPELANYKQQFNRMLGALREKRARFASWQKPTVAAEDFSGIDKFNSLFSKTLEEVSKSKGAKYFLMPNPKGGRPIRQSNINLRYVFEDGTPVTGKLAKAIFRNKMLKRTYTTENLTAHKVLIVHKTKQRRAMEENAKPGAKLPKLTEKDLKSDEYTFYIPKVHENPDLVGREGRKKMNEAKVLRDFTAYPLDPPKARVAKEEDDLIRALDAL
jgi:hypothetical protein